MNLLSFAEPEASEALEAFLGECLFSAGVWSSPRGGDDIARLRVMESSPGRVRLLGAIWLIATQTQAPFWLDLAEEVPGSARVR